MKTLLGFAFLFLAQASFAGSLASFFEGDITYHSKGHWKGSDGKKGTWTAVTTYAKVDDTTLKMTGTTTVEGYQGAEPMTTEAIYKETIEGSFDIQTTEGAKIGSGYCVENVCHIAYSTDSVSLEETFTFTRGHQAFRVLGSMNKSSEEGSYAVFWKGRGSKQRPTPETNH